jgi:hypothetical protein
MLTSSGIHAYSRKVFAVKLIVPRFSIFRRDAHFFSFPFSLLYILPKAGGDQYQSSRGNWVLLFFFF